MRAEDGLRILREKMDIIRGMMHGCDYDDFDTSPLSLLVPVTEHLLGLPDGKQRFLDVMASVTRAYSLCATLDDAVALQMEIAFFTAVHAVLMKNTTVDRKTTEEAKHSALKQILDNAILSEGVSDIFKLAGVERPNIGLMSNEFLRRENGTSRLSLDPHQFTESCGKLRGTKCQIRPSFARRPTCRPYGFRGHKRGSRLSRTSLICHNP